MKTNESIQKNIRDYVQREICRRTHSDKSMTLMWILQRFEDCGKKLSLDHLIELSEEYNVFTPPSPYNYNARQIHKGLGLEEIMDYKQFIFELPRIWYTTLFRLIQEWEEEHREGELAY